MKFSTGFKKELATLDGYALKVFLYIGLSVNFATGEAYPGVRNIAENTGMNKDTVHKDDCKPGKTRVIDGGTPERCQDYLQTCPVSLDWNCPDHTGHLKPNCPTRPYSRNKTVRPNRTPNLSDQTGHLKQNRPSRPDSRKKLSDRTGHPKYNCPTRPDT